MLANYKSSISKFTLIASNFIPLLGVLFWGWSVFSILVLYWLESVIIGFFNIFKIMLSQGTLKNRLFSSLFFIFHYGAFSTVHFIAINSLFKNQNLTPDSIGFTYALAVLGFTISHLVSFIQNSIIKGEQRFISTSKQISIPYQRVMIMHVVVILGALGVDMLGSPLIALIILIAVKTIIDLKAHEKEHSPAIL